MQMERTALFTLLVSLCACDDGVETHSGELAPVFEVVPSVSIGVMDGDPRYMFQDVSAAVRLSNGDLVVADRGTSEISIYGPSGLHKRTFGRPGEGPGEFRNIAGLYAIDGDSLVAADGFSETVAVLDTAGVHARSLRYADLPGDAGSPLGTWITGRYLVRGAFGSGERFRVDRVLARHAVPAEGLGFREAIAEPSGMVWVREPSLGTAGTWIALDDHGEATGWIDLPGDFTPLAFYPGTVLGRAMDSLGVHSLRTYAIGDATESRAVPSWLTRADEGTGVRPGEGWSPETLAEHVRGLAGSQEIYYSTHSSYSASTDSLDWAHDGVSVTFTHADARGWVGVFTSPSEPTVCAMAYGFPIPPGWRMGQLLCGVVSAG